MKYIDEIENRIRVEGYRYGIGRKVAFGHLKKGGEDQDYWHFYPSAECVLNANFCARLAEKLAELNRQLPPFDE